jgi:hypothetical protein
MWGRIAKTKKGRRSIPERKNAIRALFYKLRRTSGNPRSYIDTKRFHVGPRTKGKSNGAG